MTTDTLRSALTDATFRSRLYPALHRERSSDPGPLLRLLFAAKLAFRDDLWHGRREDEDDAFEQIYFCALLLFRLGEAGDVEILWRAKRLNMGLGASLDSQFLVGAGVETTIEYLRSVAEPWAEQALQYLTACREGGDFDDLDGWYRRKEEYYLGSAGGR